MHLVRSVARLLACVAIAMGPACDSGSSGGSSFPTTGPQEPLTADLVDRDPEVIARIDRARGAVRKADDAAAWGRLGLAFEANHIPELARPCYAHAGELASTEARWVHRRGVVSLALDDIDDARAAFEEALARDRTLAPAHWSLGFVQLERGELDAAQASFKKATRHAPSLPVGRVGNARVALQRDDPETAIRLLRKALADGPTDDYVRHLLATAYRQAGRWDEVADELGDVRPTEPQWPDPAAQELAELRAPTAIEREERAVTLALEGTNVERSIELLEELVEADPSDPALRSTLANAYVRDGRLRRAQTTYEEALAVSPDHQDSLLGLAGLLVRRGEPAAALEHVDRAIDLQPRYGRAHALRGHALRGLGRYDDALAAYDAALALDARQHALHVEAGSVALELRLWDAADRHFAAAVAAGSNAPELRAGHARALLQLERLSDAEAALDAIDAWPEGLLPAVQRLRRDLERAREEGSS